MNMNEWLKGAKAQGKTMPVLSFPGMQLINTTVDKLVESGRLQADCMKAIASRYDVLASVSLMDLSVEAEAFGSPIKFSDDEVPTVTAPIVESLEDAEALKVPKVGDKRTGEYIKTLEYASKEITNVPVFAGMIGPFSLSGRIMDMTEIMINCYTDPEMVTTVLEKVTDFLVEYAKAFKATGCNGIVIAEPAAGLLSPDLISEFSSPYVKKILDAVDDENFLVIYHNCGNVIPLIPNILTIGARVLHFGNAIDMKEAMELVPSDIVVMGNVDPSSIFRNGTPELVKQDTERVMRDCNHYPNFIVSSGCDIPPLTPLENIDTYFETVKNFK